MERSCTILSLNDSLIGGRYIGVSKQRIKQIVCEVHNIKFEMVFPLSVY